MEEFNEICGEILNELKEHDVKTQRQLNQIKLNALNKYKSKYNHGARAGSITGSIPKNADIYFAASEEQREYFKEILSLKPVRTLSGVAPIAMMSEPYPCPHTMKGIGPCSYCPGGPGSAFGNVPQSYTGKEPSTRRAIRNNYDPYLIVFNRLEHYVAMGKMPDKAEVIIQGGTFTFFPKAYQEYFVKYALKAMNDFSNLFFSEKKRFDFKKFKEFFELPRVFEDGKRTKIVQDKLLHIKNIDIKQPFLRREGRKAPNEKILKNFFVDIEDDISKKFNEVKFFDGEFSDKNIAAIKNVQNKLKNEDNKEITLKQMQKENETSFIRCVGLTIETKSDFGKLYHGNLMLELGCTRVEIGIQSIYDDVLSATNRGNSVADNIESIRILKDLGFKINCHYMPGLPNTTREMDLNGLRQMFESPDYMPDMLKIYPCMVMEGTRLYNEWKLGKFKPLTTEEAANLIAEAKRYAPKWLRIMRIQRDIPTFATASGVDRTNLRQYVEKICREKNIKCRCIRCREIGFHLKNEKIKKIDFSKIDFFDITITEYSASNGREFFIAAEDLENDVLFGFCRMRFPSQFLRAEITEGSALIRELHVFSSAATIGSKSDDSFQHRGIGKKLLSKAEDIAGKNGKNKIVVISGIGARQYFSKLGYFYDGPYMSKLI